MPFWNEVILMIHPTFGVLSVIASIWVFVEVLNISEQNYSRIRIISALVPILMWGAFLVGGYWYVTNYGADKSLIKSGPWPFAHGFVMEAKEHIFLGLLLLATFLPIASFADLVRNRGARHLVLWVSMFIALSGLLMEGAGAVVAMGTKVALLSKVL